MILSKSRLNYDMNTKQKRTRKNHLTFIAEDEYTQYTIYTHQKSCLTSYHYYNKWWPYGRFIRIKANTRYRNRNTNEMWNWPFGISIVINIHQIEPNQTFWCSSSDCLRFSVTTNNKLTNVPSHHFDGMNLLNVLREWIKFSNRFRPSQTWLLNWRSKHKKKHNNNKQTDKWTISHFMDTTALWYRKHINILHFSW